MSNGRIEHVDYNVDIMEKAYSSRLNRMNERLGLINASCLSINVLLGSSKRPQRVPLLGLLKWPRIR